MRNITKAISLCVTDVARNMSLRDVRQMESHVSLVAERTILLDQHPVQTQSKSMESQAMKQMKLRRRTKPQAQQNALSPSND